MEKNTKNSSFPKRKPKRPLLNRVWDTPETPEPLGAPDDVESAALEAGGANAREKEGIRKRKRNVFFLKKKIFCLKWSFWSGVFGVEFLKWSFFEGGRWWLVL